MVFQRKMTTFDVLIHTLIQFFTRSFWLLALSEIWDEDLIPNLVKLKFALGKKHFCKSYHS